MSIAKVLCIVGPTSSGKSELAVKLARKFNGEIVSVDSRQVYRGMDIGTGKVPGIWTTNNFLGREKKQYLYKAIPHYCIDFVDPQHQYSVAQYKKAAGKAIKDISKRGKLPILCGGTGHFMDAVVYDQNLPDVKPNPKLRRQLDSHSADQLYQQLQKLDPVRATSIDKFNKRRLVRALEIVLTTGKPVPPAPSMALRVGKGFDLPTKQSFFPGAIPTIVEGPLNSSDSLEMTPKFTALWIGINPPQEILYSKIDKRLKQRLKLGMVAEVERLHQYPSPQAWGDAPKGQRGRTNGKGLSWKKLESFGLEYKYVSLYLQGKLSYDDMVTQLSYAIKHYAKRQMTWWKRNKDIKWIGGEAEARQFAADFLKS